MEVGRCGWRRRSSWTEGRQTGIASALHGQRPRSYASFADTEVAGLRCFGSCIPITTEEVQRAGALHVCRPIVRMAREIVVPQGEDTLKLPLSRQEVVQLLHGAEVVRRCLDGGFRVRNRLQWIAALFADHDPFPTLENLRISRGKVRRQVVDAQRPVTRSEEHTSELQSLRHLVCRLLLEKKKKRFLA